MANTQLTTREKKVLTTRIIAEELVPDMARVMRHNQDAQLSVNEAGAFLGQDQWLNRRRREMKCGRVSTKNLYHMYSITRDDRWRPHHVVTRRPTVPLNSTENAERLRAILLLIIEGICFMHHFFHDFTTTDLIKHLSTFRIRMDPISDFRQLSQMLCFLHPDAITREQAGAPPCCNRSAQFCVHCWSLPSPFTIFLLSRNTHTHARTRTTICSPFDSTPSQKGVRKSFTASDVKHGVGQCTLCAFADLVVQGSSAFDRSGELLTTTTTAAAAAGSIQGPCPPGAPSLLDPPSRRRQHSDIAEEEDKEVPPHKAHFEGTAAGARRRELVQQEGEGEGEEDGEIPLFFQGASTPEPVDLAFPWRGGPEYGSLLRDDWPQ